MVALAIFLPAAAHAQWKVDLSRRQNVLRKQDLSTNREPGSVEVESDRRGLIGDLFDKEPVQELVVLNTEKGFLPATLRMRKGGKYTVHVVNVNDKEKNVSFVLDSFSEHHSTFYGKVKTFQIEPKREGVYSYQCPETSFEGKVIVFSPPGGTAPASDLPLEQPLETPSVRAPASTSGVTPAFERGE